jgi:uncharacterized membrane protein YhaH (DUF805 family)
MYQMTLGELLLSPAGRAPRRASVLAAAFLLIVAAFYEATVNSALHWWTGWFVYPALFYSGACVLSKRLHDRGRSGWWATPILVSIVAVWPHPVGFLDFVFFLVLVWAAVELAVMPGEQGANRYGLNPAAPLAPA